MSSLLELIGQFVAVLVAAAFMHFGAMLTDAVDKDTTSAAPAAKAGKATETQATTETKTSTETQTTVT